MKKFFLYLIAAVATVAAVSCNPENKTTTNEQGLVDDNGKKLTPDEQKVKIEETANALMTDLDMSVWQSEYDTVNGILMEMSEKDVDDAVIVEHLQAIVDAWTSVTGEDPFTTTTYLAKLTDLKGHFTENAEGGFDFEDADDLQVTVFSDGKTITACFSAKVSDTVVIISEGYHGSQNESGEWTEREEVFAKAYVPTEATLGLKVNGDDLAYLNIRLNYSDVNGNGYADEGDKADLGYTLKVGAYSIILDQADYATNNASVSVKFLKDQKLVLGASAKAAFQMKTYKDEYYEEQYMVPVSAEVKVDLEGKIQFEGTIPDYDTLQAAAMKQQQANDFATYSAALAEMEKAFGFGVYYDGTNTLQATLGFEPVEYDIKDQDTNGDGVVNEYDYIHGFDANPVIRFMDGTSYTAEEYFSQERFGTTMQNISDWATGILEALGFNPAEEPVK